VYSTPVGLADAVADALGDVRTEVTVPASLAAGQHTLVALGVDANGAAHTVSVSVAVPAATAALPVTGLALTGMLAAGLGSVAGGAALLLAGRRPRRTTAA
jgi:titin